MARLFIVLVTLVLGEEEKQGCQLLQTAAERRKPGGPNAGASEKDKGICGPVSIEQDLLPLKDVVESSGEDGWCVFGAKGVWASNCAVSRQTRDIDTFVKTWELDYLMVMNMPSPPYTLKLPDQRTLTIRDHNYPLDDLYCFANGWYSNSDSQREEFFKNFSYLEEVSEKSCNELQKKVPGFNKLSMKDMAEESDYDNHFLLDLAKKGGGDVSQKVVDGMYVHAAVKCLLRGGGQGAVCDIANCASRGQVPSACGTLLYSARGEISKVTK